MGRAERITGLVTLGTDSCAARVKKTRVGAGVGIMASGASALGKGRVLDTSVPPAADLIVAGGTEILALIHEQPPVGTTMGLVAFSASALGHR